MNSPWKVIKELEADNSRLAKEAIIAREATAKNQEFFIGCRLALDAMITFGVKKIAESKVDGPGLAWNHFYTKAQQLINREATGHAALGLIDDLMAEATKEQWNSWYRRILIKDMRAGFSEKTVNNVVEKLNAKDYIIPVFTRSEEHTSELQSH